MDRLIFRCWFRPGDIDAWELLEQEATLQLGLHKPNWLPRCIWRRLIAYLTEAYVEAILEKQGTFDYTSATVSKEE